MKIVFDARVPLDIVAFVSQAIREVNVSLGGGLVIGFPMAVPVLVGLVRLERNDR